MRSTARLLLPAAALAGALSTGCLPYTVGSTASTVTPHETAATTSWYYIPSAVKQPGDSVAVPLAGSNVQFRHGLDDRSDVGLVLLPAGVAADYKRRFDAGGGTALAYIVGGGIVNGGRHLMMQATLVASARDEGTLVPYGGLRAIHVHPISEGAVHDRPTIGAFGGMQIGDGDFTIRPELGIFYDHSALGLRRGDLIFVPAITVVRVRGRENYWKPRGGPAERFPRLPTDRRPPIARPEWHSGRIPRP